MINFLKYTSQNLWHYARSKSFTFFFSSFFRFSLFWLICKWFIHFHSFNSHLFMQHFYLKCKWGEENNYQQPNSWKWALVIPCQENHNHMLHWIPQVVSFITTTWKPLLHFLKTCYESILHGFWSSFSSF